MKDYKHLYDKTYFTKSRRFKLNPERVMQFVNIITEYEPESVLDVGCGLGMLVDKLNDRKTYTIGCDFGPTLKHDYWRGNPHLVQADARKLPFATGSFDLVFSSDFFEHVPAEDIDLVKNEMFRVSKNKVVARVAYEDKLTKKQAQYHVTNKPKEWWEKKLEGVELV